MLIAQLCMSMIRTNEQIVAGDMVVSIERWPMARYCPRILSPLQLYLMIE